MVGLTNVSPLGGAALLGQETLTGSILDGATALESSTSIAGALSTIRSTGVGSSHTSKEALGGSTSEADFSTLDLPGQSTDLKSTTSNPADETETTSKEPSLDSDLLTGMVEGSPLVLNASANVSVDGVSIKDTNYSIPTKAYFVSTTGRDANSGTRSSPWRTLRKAVNSAPNGSTVILRGGTYREGNLEFFKKLTFQPYPHEKVWVKGSLVVTSWAREGNLWRKDNWNHQFSPIPTGNPVLDPDHPEAAYKEMVFVDGNSLDQVRSKSQVGPGEFYLDRSGKKLYIGSNPLGKTVEATAFEEALHFNGNSAYSTVRGIGFAHYAERALTSSSNMMLENNTFAWNAIMGAMIYGTNAVVRGNTFSYNGRLGSFGSKTDRLSFENNTLSRNNVENFSNYDSGGAKFIRAKSLTLRDNVVDKNNSHGLWVDISSTNVTIVRNLVRNNRQNGIFFELSHNAVIASNLVVDNVYRGISVCDASSAKIYNNTVVNNPININLLEGPRTNTNSQEVAAGITWKTKDNIIKNNILLNPKGVVSDGGDSFLFSALNYTNINNNQMVVGLNHNAYYRAVKSTPPEVIRYKPNYNGQGIKHKTVANFRKVYPAFERNALAIDSVATNPFFINGGNGDYRLKSGSPAIKAGEPLPTNIANSIGVQAGVRVNLGALDPAGPSEGALR